MSFIDTRTKPVTEKPMFHKLCINCINSCKQNDNVKIARCPNYMKRVSESEFNSMIEELDTINKDMDTLSSKAKKLIEKAHEYDDFFQQDNTTTEN